VTASDAKGTYFKYLVYYDKKGNITLFLAKFGARAILRELAHAAITGNIK